MEWSEESSDYDTSDEAEEGQEQRARRGKEGARGRRGGTKPLGASVDLGKAKSEARPTTVQEVANGHDVHDDDEGDEGEGEGM